MESIGIIVLNYNGKQDTLRCLESLQKLNYPQFHTYVVDNGSSDDSVLAIRQQFPQITLLETGKNLGYAEGNNVGIRKALTDKHDAVLILNNDTTVDPSLLQVLIQTHKEHPQAGVLGATLYRMDYPDTLDHLGGLWNSATCTFDLVGLQTKILPFTTPTPLDYVCGAALYIPKDTLDTIGLFEKDFFLFFEDADFCFRARKAGFLILTCPHAKVWHQGSASFSGKPLASYFFFRSRLLFIKRNFSSKEKNRLYQDFLLPEFFRQLKHVAIKQCEYSLLLFLKKGKNSRFSKKNLEKKKHNLERLKASIQGSVDYLRGFFDAQR